MILHKQNKRKEEINRINTFYWVVVELGDKWKSIISVTFYISILQTNVLRKLYFFALISLKSI